MENQETKWDDRQKDNVLWRLDITDMTTTMQGKALVSKEAPADDARKEDRDETARQEGGDHEASLHAGATQDGEPEKRQLQQQPEPK
jgi:hypothetical protein